MRKFSRRCETPAICSTRLPGRCGSYATALEKEDNCAVTAAHVRNLKEIDPAALAMAYAMAEKTLHVLANAGADTRTCRAGRKRRGAGMHCSGCFAYLALHGVDGRAYGGGVRFGEDETGRRVLLETKPVIPAPSLPAEIESTLTSLGNGIAKHGLRYVSQHPVVQGWDSFTGASKTAERIEGDWLRCYRHTMRTSHHPPLKRTE